MNVEGDAQTRLTTNSADNVIPLVDRRRPDPVQVRSRWAVGIYVMNADGGGQTRLSSDGGLTASPPGHPTEPRSRSPRECDGKDQIYVMNADGSNLPAIVQPAFSENPAWSPDGSQIAYDADGNGDGWQELWLMDATGGNQRQVYDPPESNTEAWARSWSPDGRYVAFTRISFIQYQGNWYWTTAYLDALDSPDPVTSCA